MDRLDFRSDTVTWPTQAMRRAMAEARVGDDVYGEDPTVNALEEKAAAMVGMEAGLFVASGTMGNLVAILTHAGRGEEAIVGARSHTITYEAGGMAALGGVIPRVLPTDDYGQMDIDQLRKAIGDDDPHHARTRLILLENTFGAANGYPLPAAYFAAVSQIAREDGLSVHIDGARFFNAITALDIEAAAITQFADSLSFCLSKGLCAPVGSVLCGSHNFIHRARRARKILGGGMRQAGVLAAAGLIALDEMVPRLHEDHALARRLAEGLPQIPGLNLAGPEVKTNIVYFELNDNLTIDQEYVARRLREEANIWIDAFGPKNFRAVTHYWISARDVDQLLGVLRKILKEERVAPTDIAA